MTQAESPQPTLRLLRLRPGVRLPAYQTEHAAGLDLAAAIDAPVTLTPVVHGGRAAFIPCGFAMSLPPGFEAQVRPRSGLASRHGVTLPNAPGTIDADYRGEVIVPLINLGPEPFVVEPGMRVAQMVIAPVAQAVVREVERLDDPGENAPTQAVGGRRGAGGFGSTGLT